MMITGSARAFEDTWYNVLNKKPPASCQYFNCSIGHNLEVNTWLTLAGGPKGYEVWAVKVI